MRYLWQTPIRMDNARLLSVLGAEPRMALEQAVRATLADLGCLNNRRDLVSRMRGSMETTLPKSRRCGWR